jgi:hypothetical protein
MQFSEVYGQVTTRTNDASSNATTVAKANVNHAYQDVCTRYPFTWLIGTGTITTVASQAYNQISTSGITDLWKVLSIRETTTPALLTAINRKTYEAYVADDNTTKDVPECYCDEFNDYIYWYHTPDAIYALPVTYWKFISDRSADADTFVIPVRFQEVLVLGGWYRQLQYFNRYGEATAIKAEYESKIQQLIDEDSDRPDLIEYQSRHLIGAGRSGDVQLPSQYRRY